MSLLALIFGIFGLFLTIIFGYGIAVIAYGVYDKLIPKSTKKNITEKTFVIIFTFFGIIIAWILFSTPWNGM